MVSGKLQTILIVVLVLFNFILLARHVKLLREISIFNAERLRVMIEENSIAGKKLPETVLNLIRHDKSKYFLILVFKGGDCSACLRYIVPLLSAWG